MGILDFMKSAGEKVLGAATAGNTAGALLDHLKAKGLASTDLKVEYDAASATVKVVGTAGSQADKEKVLLALGNIQGVEKVDDDIHAGEAGVAAGFYTVQKGDTLGSIAKAHYGKSGAYVKIFEANQPLLKDPDKIYPGQVLRLPAA
jgi:nucleoid-associated protein YgaU